MVPWSSGGGGAEELEPATVVGVRDESARALESSCVVMPATLEMRKEVKELIVIVLS